MKSKHSYDTIISMIFLGLVNCVSNSYTSEITNTNAPKIIPVITFIDPTENMKRNVTTDPIIP
jgi:hypothetical protein